MARAYASAVIPAPAEQVWELVREFNGLPDWHPAIATSEIESGRSAGEVGAVRRLGLPDGGGTVRERLVALDDTARSYTYDMIEGPFPIRTYRSTITVFPITATGQAFVEWFGDYDTEAAEESKLEETFGGGVYAAGLKALVERFS